MTFKEFGLHPGLLEAISYFGFDTATPVQEQVMPAILGGRDVIACAQTGTGKTGAFVLPVLNRLAYKEESTTDTLIVVPTRELALQIDQQIQGFSYFIPVGCIAIYGGGDGHDWESQRKALKNGVDIIVATPGKLLSHLNMGNISLKHLRHFILDEADRMLDMGFAEDIAAIMSHLPAKRQSLMFSATMPQGIRQLARKLLNNPFEISLAVSKPAAGVDHKICFVSDFMKNQALVHLINNRPHYDSIIIFSSTKSKISEIVRTLQSAGFSAKGISSNLEQSDREKVLNAFAARQVRILVATDVVSRGIDIKDINMVLNYDVPHDAEDYVHRVGRTARVNATGEAVTFVTPRDAFRIKEIERLTGMEIPVLPLPPEFSARAAASENNSERIHGKRKFNHRRKK